MKNLKIIQKIINYIDSILKYTHDVDYIEGTIVEAKQLASFFIVFVLRCRYGIIRWYKK